MGSYMLYYPISEACKTTLNLLEKIPVYVCNCYMWNWVVNVVSDDYFLLPLEYQRSN